jgi:hypothetical protein
MLTDEDVIEVSEVLAEMAAATAADLSEGDVAGEEDFSGQLIGRCKGKLQNYRTPNARWRVGATVTEAEDGPPIPSVRFSARQTQSKGRGSEESWSGADLLMVLQIVTPDYEVRKGVLVQAKNLEPGKKLDTSIANDLRGQCTDMLNLTSSSFVFLYSKSGVTTLSATQVEGSKRNDLHVLEQWEDSTLIFFMDFIKCWVGDPRLKATDKTTLAVLRALSHARNAILLRADQGE